MSLIVATRPTSCGISSGVTRRHKLCSPAISSTPESPAIPSTTGRLCSNVSAHVRSQLWLLPQHSRYVVAFSSKTRRLPGAGASDDVKQEIGLPGDAGSRAFAVAMAAVADETKCSDILVLDVAPVVSWTSFMVICTVFSKPQMMAVLSRMEKAAQELHSRERTNQPGNSPWEVLDFGSVICHIFTAEQRDHYDIESFYAACEEVDLPFYSSVDSFEGAMAPQRTLAQSIPPVVPQWTTNARY